MNLIQSAASVLALLLLICVSAGSSAQFSRFEEAHTAPDANSPRASLLRGLSNLLYGYAYTGGNDQRWDSASRHYRGNLPGYLRYEALARAGYHGFAIVDAADFQGVPNLTYATPERVVEEADRALSRNPGRIVRSYHFDDSGWLRAILMQQLLPEYEGFIERRDSFFYEQQPGGGRLIRWTEQELQTSSGEASRLGCPPIRGFHSIVRTGRCDINLDRWDNVVRLESRHEELWDTCRGEGPIIWNHRFSYDAEGRPLTVTDSNGKYASASSESRYRYDDLTLGAFLDSVKTDYRYGPMRESAIRSWLEARQPLQVIVRRAEYRQYVRYDSRIRAEIICPDSPVVRADTSICVVDRQRRRIVYRAGEPRSPFRFYSRGPDPASGAELLRVQQLPLPPDPAAGAVTVCDPLALSRVSVQKTASEPQGADTLIRFFSYDPDASYPGYGAKLRAEQFSETLTVPRSFTLRSLELRDRRGLTKYLWLQDHCYKLSYE